MKHPADVIIKAGIDTIFKEIEGAAVVRRWRLIGDVIDLEVGLPGGANIIGSANGEIEYAWNPVITDRRDIRGRHRTARGAFNRSGIEFAWADPVFCERKAPVGRAISLYAQNLPVWCSDIRITKT